jgi:hypothetical protein
VGINIHTAGLRPTVTRNLYCGYLHTAGLWPTLTRNPHCGYLHPYSWVTAYCDDESLLWVPTYSRIMVDYVEESALCGYLPPAWVMPYCDEESAHCAYLSTAWVMAYCDEESAHCGYLHSCAPLVRNKLGRYAGVDPTIPLLIYI